MPSYMRKRNVIAVNPGVALWLRYHVIPRQGPSSNPGKCTEGWLLLDPVLRLPYGILLTATI